MTCRLVPMQANNEWTAYRTIFEVLYGRLNEDVLETIWARFGDGDGDLYSQFLLHQFGEDGQFPEQPIFMRLDWKASDEDLSWNANCVLKTLGFEDNFEWTFYDSSGAEPQMGFYFLDQWLRRQGQTLIWFQTDGDYYVCAIVSAADIATLEVARTNIAHPTWAYAPRPLFGTVPDEWQHDPIPERPNTPNEPRYTLRWRTSGQHDSPHRGWSSEFEDSQFGGAHSFDAAEALRAEFETENPTLEAKVTETGWLTVGDGAPDSWFVVVQQEQRKLLRRTPQVQFVARVGGKTVVTTDLSSTRASRGWATRARSLAPDASERIVTIAEARTLLDR